jgi:threonine dehydratase
MVTQETIAAAYSLIQTHIRKTPTLEVEAGTLFEGERAHIKLEQLQITGSFKVRGAFNAILTAPLSHGGVVAFSGGNHGAAIAYAATKLGVRSTIFVPEFAGAVKIQRMKNFGANVVVCGTDINETIRQFEDHALRTGAIPIHPYNDSAVMCGQGTLGLEMEQQMHDIDTLFVSVGGGGLIAGIASWYSNSVKIVAVETEGTCTLATRLAQGPSAQIQASGVAASALGAPTMGALPMQILDRVKPASVVVSDGAVIDAQKKLWETTRIICEPGAAVALAALTSGAYRPGTGERVGVLICGGNAYADWFMHP